MRIGILGGTGPAGSGLAARLACIGYEAVIGSRSKYRAMEARDHLVERWPDMGYPPGHACHNPYGVWHVGPPGGKARALHELHLSFNPPLLAILTELEAKKRKPLTQEQVEKTRDDSVCIAMPPRDAQLVDRRRGFSDLDPELVWEQWQAWRTSRKG